MRELKLKVKKLSLLRRVLNFTSLGYNYRIMRMNIIKSIKKLIETMGYFRYRLEGN